MSDGPVRSPFRYATQNLLFGLLALQNGFISRDALVAAFGAWIADKARPLGQILLDQGKLDADCHGLLMGLVRRHLEAHGGDPEESLADLSSLGSALRSLVDLGDPDLSAGLEQLGTTLRYGPDPDVTATTLGAPTSPGGRFRVLRLHAQGGLGEVYVARDEEVRREVALKQIKSDHAADSQGRARFLLEAEITGGLEHPGIVPVYGLGTYDDGRPFYAMRFIKGDSLKEAIARFHADEATQGAPGPRSLALNKLLRRFLDVCNALSYAHSRGVLHRDLKPGNIMLGEYGETLVVDWGLAKAVGHRLDPAASAGLERTLQPESGSDMQPTVVGSRLGTPAYMSPEQAAGRLDELGAPSDVYSLGATLYVLLTGRPPFLEPDLATLLHRVEQGEFPRPRQLRPWIDPGLEGVCLKAMARRPEDRYASPRALAEDVEHWLADEPVIARADPPLARAARWVRKHRTAAASLLILLGTGLVASSLGLYFVDRERSRAVAAEGLAKAQGRIADGQRDRAVRAEGEARTLLARAEEGERKARQSESEARSVLTFLQDKVLAAGRPEGQEGGLGREVKLRAAIDAAEAGIAAGFAGQPTVEASVRDALGASYYYLGEPPLAIRQFKRAQALRAERLGPGHPDTLDSLNSLAVTYRAAGRTAEAIPLLQAGLAASEASLGADHKITLNARNSLAVAYLDAGRIDEAVRLHERSLEAVEAKLGPDHPTALTYRNNLASAYCDAGRIDEAIRLHERTLRESESRLGPDHPSTLLSRNNLASAYSDAGRTAEAIELHERNLRSREAKLGPDHPSTFQSRNNLASAYRDAGRIDEAIRLHERNLRAVESKLGPAHPNTLTSRNNLASAYGAAGRIGEAIRLHERNLEAREAKFGPDHPDTFQSRNNLAEAYRESDRTAEAVRLHERNGAAMEAKLGPDHPSTLTSRNNLGLAYLESGRAADAIRLHEQTLKARVAKLGLDHPDTSTSRHNLGLDYESLDRWPDAEPLYRDNLARLKRSQKPDRRDLADALASLGRTLMGQSKWTAAEPVLREWLTLRGGAAPERWHDSLAMNQLGGAIARQGRYAEAESLLLEGCEGMRRRERTIPLRHRRRLTEAALSVVRLYEDWGKAEKALEWRARLGLLNLPADVFDRP